MSVGIAKRTKGTMDIDGGYCLPLLSWNINYQSVLAICANLYARDCQALSAHERYAKEETVSTIITETHGRLTIQNYSDPPGKENTLWRSTSQLLLRLHIRLNPTRV